LGADLVQISLQLAVPLLLLGQFLEAALQVGYLFLQLQLLLLQGDPPLPFNPGLGLRPGSPLLAGGDLRGQRLRRGLQNLAQIALVMGPPGEGNIGFYKD